mgnify:CR=1 FL=1
MKLRLARKMVLLIEPDPKIFNRITEALVGVGVTLCVIVPSAAEALTKLKLITPDLAFLNDALPDETSDVVAHWLVERNIPFAYISAGSGPRAGARLSLDLPIDPRAVIDVAGRLVGERTRQKTPRTNLV